MVADIQKIEAAARTAMGHFEGQPDGAAAPAYRFLHPTTRSILALAALTGLAIALF